MIAPVHPLAPWSREESLAVVTAQIERNRAADADRLDARNARIVAAVEAGATYACVAESMDLTPAIVAKVVARYAPHLHELIRERNRARRCPTGYLAERNEAIIAEVEMGASYREVALQFGMTVDAVRQTLARHAPHLMVSRRAA